MAKQDPRPTLPISLALRRSRQQSDLAVLGRALSVIGAGILIAVGLGLAASSMMVGLILLTVLIPVGAWWGYRSGMRREQARNASGPFVQITTRRVTIPRAAGDLVLPLADIQLSAGFYVDIAPVTRGYRPNAIVLELRGGTEDVFLFADDRFKSDDLNLPESQILFPAGLTGHRVWADDLEAAILALGLDRATGHATNA